MLFCSGCDSFPGINMVAQRYEAEVRGHREAGEGLRGARAGIHAATALAIR